MSDECDLLLDNPGEAELAAALHRVSGREPDEQSGRERWNEVLDEIGERAEGCCVSAGARGNRPLRVAWWSDYQGVKHVRVRGETRASQLDHDKRPPLWHVFGERVYRVSRPGQAPVWLVSCACGATGKPGGLAWMGERCGPCHDRIEEGVPLPDEQRAVLLTCLGPCHAIAFSPDGRQLAVSSAGACLTLWNMENGERRILCDGGDQLYYPLTFSPEGRFLAAGLSQEWYIALWDFHNDGKMLELLLHYSGADEARGLVYSPDGRLFATWSDQGRFAILTADGRETPCEDWRSIGYSCTALAFAPDSRTLALGSEDGGVVSLHDTAEWKQQIWSRYEADPAREVLFLAYTPDGQRLVLIVGNRDTEHRDQPDSLYLCRLVRWESEERWADLPGPTRVAALSPDGRYLAFVIEGGDSAAIHFWRLDRWTEGGCLEWDTEDEITGLVFSPDGQTLATGSRAGVVKLWPWRLLIEGE